MVAMGFLPIIVIATFLQRRQLSQESDDYKLSLQKSTKVIKTVTRTSAESETFRQFKEKNFCTFSDNLELYLLAAIQSVLG